MSSAPARRDPGIAAGSRLRRARVAAIVEMALVVPLLLVLFFALAELSVGFLRWQAVTAAAREGARAASVYRPDCALTVDTAVERAANRVLATAGLPSPSIETTGACTSGSSTVEVRVPYRFRILPDFASGLGTIDLTATSVMRNEAGG
jgi:Flp pilus assembly protein TadG